MDKKGTLFLVGTPIGNLGDCTTRLKTTLEAVGIVYAEDTRVTKALLTHLGLSANLRSFHEHNSRSREVEIIAELERGQDVAVVSDAGMPCVSDPGQGLVSLCHDRSITVSVIPGPSAVVTALAASGFKSRRFCFEGFLPVKGKERKDLLAEIALEKRTIILYEAPHRVVKTLTDLAEVGLSKRLVTVGRELTKRYETYHRQTIADCLKFYSDEKEPRGEFTLVIEGLFEYLERSGETQGTDSKDICVRASVLVQSGFGAREIGEILQKEFALSKNRAYKVALEAQISS